jgi:hypothetical protein
MTGAFFCAKKLSRGWSFIFKVIIFAQFFGGFVLDGAANL